MTGLIQQIINEPVASVAIVINLIIIEGLLSVDNAAVLATMVQDLPKAQKENALKYGLFGAYLFRGLAMVFAAYLIKIWFIKPLGGLYLLYLVYEFWKRKKKKGARENEVIDKQKKWLYRVTVGRLGDFWATVCIVELMDMAFSIDNVFAAIAFTPNILLVCTGIFIGMLAMRFVAQWFVKLMAKYAFLETAAFVVIGILGIKLSISLYEHFYPKDTISLFLSSRTADIVTSIITVTIFFVPVITSTLFNYPKNDSKIK